MTGRPTSRVLVAGILAVVGLFVAVATRRPDGVVLAAPFLLVALTGVVGGRVPAIAATLTVQSRLTEGEPTEVVLAMDVTGRGLARIRLVTPAGMVVEGEMPASVEVPLRPGRHEERWLVRPTGWGVPGPIRVSVVVCDAWGTRVESSVLATEPIRVYPTEQTIRRTLSPSSLRTIAGAHLARQRGDGVEFMDVREFVRGDRAKDVNWRVSARREQLWVDQRQPERSGDVVLFIDSFAAVGSGLDSTLRRSAEVAAALIRRHVGLNDRLGLVDLGGVLRWVRPGGGTAHLYRLVDTLIETERYVSAAAKTIDTVPARALPTRSLVVALTPLLDSRGIDAVRSLRARGFDVAVVEISPEPFLSGGEGPARGLWELERESLRSDLRRRGIAVATWDGEEPLDRVVQTLAIFRSAVLRAAR